MFGGAAGGGKSSALLMAALQWVEYPSYSAILLRRTYADLTLPGALMDRAQEWLAGTKASWSDKEKTWRFPKGGTLTFGYLETEKDKYRYQSSEFQMIGFDELTQFTESQYTYLFSRLRRNRDQKIPLRMRAGSNPGGVGHSWVKSRFLKTAHPERIFIPSRIQDNPYLDQEQYRKALAELDPFTRKQLAEGNWSDFEGGRFKSSWFARRYQNLGDAYRLLPLGNIIYYTHCLRFVTVDPAASEKQTSDYTAITTWAIAPGGDLLLLDVVHDRFSVDAIVPQLAGVCRTWEPAFVGIEDSGFQVAIVLEADRHPDIPVVRRLSPQGKGKLVRATPAIVKAERGQIILPQDAPWLDGWLEEHVQFTGLDDEHDDRVDTTSYAVACCDQYGGAAEEPVIGTARAW